MALTLDELQMDRSARELAGLTDETPMEAVRTSLKERLQREALSGRRTAGLAEQLMALGEEGAALPVLDARTPNEICGYDETGMWT